MSRDALRPSCARQEPPRVKSSDNVEKDDKATMVHSVSTITIGPNADSANHLTQARTQLQVGLQSDSWTRDPAHFASGYSMDVIGSDGRKCAVVDTALSALLGLKRAAEFVSHCRLSNVTDTPIKLCCLLNSNEQAAEDGGFGAVLQHKLASSEHLCVFVHGYAASKEVWATHMPHIIAAACSSGHEFVGIAMSLFGSEGTCPNARPRKLHEAACQAADVLLKLGLERRKLLLIGHSMGGNVVLRMLLQAPITLHKESSELCALSLTPVVSSDPTFLPSLHDTVGNVLRGILLKFGLLEYVKNNKLLIDVSNKIYHIFYMTYSQPSASQERRVAAARAAVMAAAVLFLTRGRRRPRLHMRHPIRSTTRWLAILGLLCFAAHQGAMYMTNAAEHNVPEAIQKEHGAHFGTHAANYLVAITEGIMGQSSELTEREIAQLSNHRDRILVVVASDDRLINSWTVIDKLQNSLPLIFCRGSHYVQCGPDFPRILDAVLQLAQTLPASASS